jgi:lipopolysaccharide heptosyltransferase III
MTRIDLSARPRILVITLRRLGDVLLTTSLTRCLRRQYPQAILHMLVFRSSAGILEGNPDLDAVITVSERPAAGESLRLMRNLWRRYDLAVSTQPGDRPTLYALVAGRRRASFVPAEGETGAGWKRRAHHVALPLAPNQHRVGQLMALAQALGLNGTAEIVCPHRHGAPDFALRRPYAVVHANPFYQYKRWTKTGWRELACGLNDRGLSVVATEGPDPAERAYLDDVWGSVRPPVNRIRADWPDLACLLKGAALYVGPDTSTTHLAAATGCPTIALYGPTSPRLIGPWPIGGLSEDWDEAGSIQRRGNVWVVQNPLACLPCEKLGCEGHLESYSRCMDELPASRILAAVDEALRYGAGSAGMKQNSAPNPPALRT